MAAVVTVVINLILSALIKNRYLESYRVCPIWGPWDLPESCLLWDLDFGVRVKSGGVPGLHLKSAWGLMFGVRVQGYKRDFWTAIGCGRDMGNSSQYWGIM